MNIVLLKDVRTEVGTYLCGTQVPAMPDGQGGWLMQVGMIRRDGRARTVHLDAKAARPTRDLEWRNRAACRGVPTDAFYPNPANWGAESRAARKMCDACPVRAACAQNALDNREEHGIFAGINVRQPGAREKLAAIAVGGRAK